MTELLGVVTDSMFIQQGVARWMVLLYLGMAFGVTYRAGYVNLGISAQLILSSLAAFYVAASTHSVMLAVGAATGAAVIVGLLPVVLKLRYGASEVLTSLFLTFAAIPLGQAIMGSRAGGFAVATPSVPAVATIPLWKGSAYLSWLHLIAPAVWVAIWIVLERTQLGFKARLVRECPTALTPTRPTATLVWLSTVGGVLVTCVVLADAYAFNGRYVHGMYDSTGFLGIAVALVALERPKWMLVSAAFIAIVEAGFLALKAVLGIPQVGAQAVFGLLIVAAAVALRPAGDGTDE